MNKFVLITGAGMHNIGAQAMMFITIDEIRKKNPELDIYVKAKKPEDYERYDFSFEVPSPQKTWVACLPKMFRKIIAGENVNAYDKYDEFMKSCAGIIDVSGFAYGSSWGIYTSINYLVQIGLARKYNVPIYLMPQSFGPLNFKGKRALLLKVLAKRFFPYCKVIMAREMDGKLGLEKEYGLKNVIKTDDMVLQNVGIDINNIYVNKPNLKNVDVQNNSVALIPNAMNIRHGDSESVFETYSEVISRLLEKGKNVYLFSHAVMDKELCQQLKDLYKDDNRVLLIQDYLSCVEFDTVVNKFDYIVASRFHAIVHGYKNCVPAVILGWAVKYQELAHSLKQEKYQVNVSKKNFKEELLKLIDQMDINWKQEKIIISDCVNEIQKHNVFDYVEL